MATPVPPQSPMAEPPKGADLSRLLLLSALIGVLAAIAASLFQQFVSLGQEFFYRDLPERFGLSGAPWWWAAIMLMVGAGIVALAQRMKGGTGQGPLTGFHFNVAPDVAPSILIAALGTLIFGFALGPEAPLIVLGTTVGALIARRASPDVRKAAMFLGGAAAIGAVFGNPFVTGFMILEFAAMGVVPSMMVLPAFVALASGYLVQIGIWGLPGFGSHSLAVPGLPVYDSIVFGDLLSGAVVAVIAGVVAVVARKSGVRFSQFTQPRPVVGLFAAAVITAVVLFIAEILFDIGVEEILFSGNSGMASLVQETSVMAVVVIVVGKGIAYSVALGGGLRGGPIFPATFLGVGVGVLVFLLLPFSSLSPLVAVGIAASAAAMIKMPATSALLAALLVAGAGAAIAPFAILGAVIGFLIRMAADDPRVRVRAPRVTMKK